MVGLVWVSAHTMGGVEGMTRAGGVGVTVATLLQMEDSGVLQG